MSGGYFSLLAARTLGVAQRLGPIVPTRFEPVEHQIPFAEEVEERLLPARPAPSAAMSASGEAPGLEARPDEQPLREQHEDIPLVRAPIPRRDGDPRPEVPVAPVRVRKAEPVRARPVSVIAIGGRSDADVRPDPDGQDEVFDDARLLAPVSVPPMTSQRQPRAPVGVGEDTASMAPTVIVRIGRIDVRAVTSGPAQPPPPSERGSKRPSLADHLRARNEGRR